jgi:hypothetical protein
MLLDFFLLLLRINDVSFIITKKLEIETKTMRIIVTSVGGIAIYIRVKTVAEIVPRMDRRCPLSR